MRGPSHSCPHLGNDNEGHIVPPAPVTNDAASCFPCPPFMQNGLHTSPLQSGRRTLSVTMKARLLSRMSPSATSSAPPLKYTCTRPHECGVTGEAVWDGPESLTHLAYSRTLEGRQRGVPCMQHSIVMPAGNSTYTANTAWLASGAGCGWLAPTHTYPRHQSSMQQQRGLPKPQNPFLWHAIHAPTKHIGFLDHLQLQPHMQRTLGGTRNHSISRDTCSGRQHASTFVRARVHDRTVSGGHGHSTLQLCG